VEGRVDSLDDFGKPTGEFGTVEQANEDGAIVKADGGGLSLDSVSDSKPQERRLKYAFRVRRFILRCLAISALSQP